VAVLSFFSGEFRGGTAGIGYSSPVVVGYLFTFSQKRLVRRVEAKSGGEKRVLGTWVYSLFHCSRDPTI
jgi:hypothetical protein